MENLRKFYIDGQWVDPISARTMQVVNPATEQKIGNVALGNAEDVDRAVAAASSAFGKFSQFSKKDRLDLLKAVLMITDRRLDDLAQAMSMEMGAPITMARSAQADAAIGHLKGFIDALEDYDERSKLKNGDIIVREPIGVCGLITPWNWPINQITLKVLPALATGCTCILKPSEYTPISAMIYAEILNEAGYPKGVFNLVHGEGPVVGTAMSQHPDIQMMSFTGSTRAGTAVTCDAAEPLSVSHLNLAVNRQTLFLLIVILKNELSLLSMSVCSIQVNPVMPLHDCWLNVLVTMMFLVLQSEQLNRQMLATQLRKGTILVLYLTSFNLNEFRG